MQPEELHARIQAELEYARAARLKGKEGRARVCARRAAGWAISANRAKHGETEQSALRSLQWLETDTASPEQLRSAASRLVAQVDEEHQLPHDEDPLKDAELIISIMLAEEA